MTNARQHRKRRWVFNLDLQDFFPSINFGRVRGFLIKDRNFALNEKAATVIAQIACHDGSLPQGSPCSPVISNLVAHVLDIRLMKLADKAGCTYSRYADDLTFSTNKKEFPGEIARRAGEDGPEAHRWLSGDALQDVITRSGFTLNPKKTRFMYRTSRQEVTGLVVNQKISVRWDYRHDVRAMVRRLVTTGEFEIYGPVMKDGNLTMGKRPGIRSELHGMLGFIDAIDFYNARRTRDKPPSPKFSSKERVYRQFLMYATFYAPLMPVILCEGDTDNVYLTHAIRSMAADFPVLAQIANQNKIVLKIRIYKYPKSSTARLLDLASGGYSALINFMTAFRKETDKFGPGLTEPVVIVYDNDSGGKSLRNFLKQTFKISCTGEEPFVHAFKNLYTVPTPLGPNGSPSEIEDLFDTATRSIQINGKSFSTAKDIDEASQYGKRIFAHKVVAAKAAKIDFSGFRPLLTNIANAIRAHRASIIQPSAAP